MGRERTGYILVGVDFTKRLKDMTKDDIDKYYELAEEFDNKYFEVIYQETSSAEGNNIFIGIPYLVDDTYKEDIVKEIEFGETIKGLKYKVKELLFEKHNIDIPIEEIKYYYIQNWR